MVVGESRSSGGYRAFRWDAVNGMVSLGTLAGGSSSNASAANADGSVIVGESSSDDGWLAFRWESGTGMVSLGTLTGGSYSEAKGVSAEGSVIVGRANATEGIRAFRWQAGTGMVSLGTLTGGTSSRAFGVSADGSVTVGYSDSTNGTRAFIYHSTMLDLVNTQMAIGQSAADQAAAVGMRNAVMNFTLNRELTVNRPAATKADGPATLPMALRLEAGLADSSGTGQQHFGGITAALGLSDSLTLNGFVSGLGELRGIDGLDLSGDQTAIGFSLRSNSAGNTGLTWRLAVARSGGDADISRSSALADTESGSGNASLTTLAARGEIGYGFDRGFALLTPYLRIENARTTRGAYTESGSVSSPASFDAYTSEVTTATLGLNGELRASANTSLRFGIGAAHDLNRSGDPVTGTSLIPGLASFSVAAPTVLNQTRAFASAGVSYFLTNGAEIALDAELAQSAYRKAPTGIASISYAIRF